MPPPKKNWLQQKEKHHTSYEVRYFFVEHCRLAHPAAKVAVDKIPLFKRFLRNFPVALLVSKIRD